MMSKNTSFYLKLINKFNIIILKIQIIILKIQIYKNIQFLI
jgi:hypothetical protein